MKTTYSQMYKSMECPVCGKTLLESIDQDKVACQDPKCKFNVDWIVSTDIANKESEDFSCRVYARKRTDGFNVEKVEYFK